MMKKILAIGLGALLLSGCSPQQLFELMAKSDIEQASSESVKQSNQIIDNFESLITTKKAEFKAFAKLESQVGDTSYGYMFQDGGDKSNKTEVYAILPNLDKDTDFYQAWFIDSQTGKTVSLGRMVFDKASNSRSVTFNSPVSLRPFKSTFVTIQEGNDKVPGKHILEFKSAD